MDLSHQCWVVIAIKFLFLVSFLQNSSSFPPSRLLRLRPVLGPRHQSVFHAKTTRRRNTFNSGVYSEHEKSTVMAEQQEISEDGFETVSHQRRPRHNHQQNYKQGSHPHQQPHHRHSHQKPQSHHQHREYTPTERRAHQQRQKQPEPQRHTFQRVREPSPDQIRIQNEYTMSYLKTLEYFGDDVQAKTQVVLMLCGIPGCGKSTLANRIMEAVNHENNEFPTKSPEEEMTVLKIVSLNQDVLKSRGMVEEYMRDALLQREQSVIVDRCNFDPHQRGHWMQIANQRRFDLFQQSPTDMELLSYQGPHVICVVLKDYRNVPVCRERAFARGDSDGIHDASTDWTEVCNAMRSQWIYPELEEHRHLRLDAGLQCIFHCTDVPSDVDAFIAQLGLLRL